MKRYMDSGGQTGMISPLQPVQKREKHRVEIKQPPQPETERNYGLRIVIVLLVIATVFGIKIAGV